MSRVIIQNNQSRNRRITLLIPNGYKLFSKKPFSLSEFDGLDQPGKALLSSRTITIGPGFFGDEKPCHPRCSNT